MARNDVIMIFLMFFLFFFGGEEELKTREDKRIAKLELFFKTALSGHILKKVNAFTFWCMVIPLDSHLVYT